jgi:hypothetical protein
MTKSTRRRKFFGFTTSHYLSAAFGARSATIFSKRESLSMMFAYVIKGELVPAWAMAKIWRVDKMVDKEFI